MGEPFNQKFQDSVQFHYTRFFTRFGVPRVLAGSHSDFCAVTFVVNGALVVSQQQYRA